MPHDKFDAHTLAKQSWDKLMGNRNARNAKSLPEHQELLMNKTKLVTESSNPPAELSSKSLASRYMAMYLAAENAHKAMSRFLSAAEQFGEVPDFPSRWSKDVAKLNHEVGCLRETMWAHAYKLTR